MPAVTINGEHVHYQLHHAAPRPTGLPLVLVHGAGGNLMHWPGALRRLLGRTVYALDLPGHGKSGDAGRAEIGAYADVVRGFAEALGLVPFVLAGHSMGGAIALEFALRYPARLAGLILVGTGAKLRVAPEIMTGILDDFAGTTELLAKWAHGEHVDPNLLRLYTRRLREVAPQVLHADFARLRRLRPPRRREPHRSPDPHPLRRRRPHDPGQVQPVPARADRRLAAHRRARRWAYGHAGAAGCCGGGGFSDSLAAASTTCDVRRGINIIPRADADCKDRDYN